VKENVRGAILARRDPLHGPSSTKVGGKLSYAPMSKGENGRKQSRKSLTIFVCISFYSISNGKRKSQKWNTVGKIRSIKNG
jgi:hypothetical protein